MGWFDWVRLGLAWLLVVTGPGAILFWFPVHPLAGFWRRVGWRWGYVAGYGVFSLTGVALLIVGLNSSLLSIEYGTNPWTIGAGVVVTAGAVIVARQRRQHLTQRMLLGLPELAPAQYPGVLLTNGIYGRVRHPRYLEILLFMLGYSLISNYLAVYGALVVMAVSLAVLIPIEERELVARFGHDYIEYRQRIPAIVPRLGGAPRELGL
jgi:protein-S-isoprenylcysteine O-methyltransferase Ste14